MVETVAVVECEGRVSAMNTCSEFDIISFCTGIVAPSRTTVSSMAQVKTCTNHPSATL
jgi:hypothetical protein